MNSWITRHIKLIAYFFASVFIGAITIHTLCDVDIIEYAPNLSRSIENHESHHHHLADAHLKEQKLVETIPTGSKKQVASSDEDACCDDAAGALYSSLYAKLNLPQVPQSNYFLAKVVDYVPFIRPTYITEHTIFHVFDDPPPRSGFDIRIDVQSFLN